MIRFFFSADRIFEKSENLGFSKKNLGFSKNRKFRIYENFDFSKIRDFQIFENSISRKKKIPIIKKKKFKKSQNFIEK